MGECFEYANPFQEWALKDPKMFKFYDILVGNVFVRMEVYKKILQFRKTLLELFKTNNNSDEIAQQMIISLINNLI